MANYIAVDLGASSGRVILGKIDDQNITLQEIHRFENGPIEVDNSFRWDFNKLMTDIKDGLKKAILQSNGKIESIAVDSWGVDFGHLDSDGKLIENPYHYRDARTDQMCEKAFQMIPRKEIYNITGIQFMQLNSIFQLLAVRQTNPELLKKTDKICFMADLISYHLCGEIYAEYTLASTSQLMDMTTGQWADEIFAKLDLPIDIMPKVFQPGTVVGKLTDEIAAELGGGNIPVVASGSHDTASAVASVPAVNENSWAYLSSGTWSLMGLETPTPVINDDTYEFQFTNEGGVYQTIRLLKNIMGLWIIQECKRQWQLDGEDLSFAHIAEMATQANEFQSVINPNDPLFLPPNEMPKKINQYLREHNQQETDDKGQMARIIFESLAFYYRYILEKIERINDKKIDILHLVGGGIKNELLCQLTANAIGRKVLAGPVEATATGNILIQAIACGQVDTVENARGIVANSFHPKEYLPQNVEKWQQKYEKAVKFFD